MPTAKTLDTFIHRWQGIDGSERANYTLFIAELCELRALPKPDPAREDIVDTFEALGRARLIDTPSDAPAAWQAA
jgi:hypothetical protein